MAKGEGEDDPTSNSHSTPGDSAYYKCRNLDASIARIFDMLLAIFHDDVKMRMGLPNESSFSLKKSHFLLTISAYQNRLLL